MCYKLNGVLGAIPVALILAGAVPGVANADWAALSWDACGAGVLNKQFACDSNTGSARIVVSAFRNQVLEGVTQGFACTLEFVPAAASLPAWWQMAPGQCRDGALGALAQPLQEDEACFDAWGFPPVTTRQLTQVPGQPGVQLAVLGFDLSQTNVMEPAIETFLVEIVINYVSSVGSGSCEGCSSEACILLRPLTLYPVGLPLIEGIPPLSGREMLGWQTTREDCIATPVRQKTWGAIKSLYR